MFFSRVNLNVVDSCQTLHRKSLNNLCKIFLNRIQFVSDNTLFIKVLKLFLLILIKNFKIVVAQNLQNIIFNQIKAAQMGSEQQDFNERKSI